MVSCSLKFPFIQNENFLLIEPLCYQNFIKIIEQYFLNSFKIKTFKNIKNRLKERYEYEHGI